MHTLSNILSSTPLTAEAESADFFLRHDLAVANLRVVSPHKSHFIHKTENHIYEEFEADMNMTSSTDFDSKMDTHNYCNGTALQSSCNRTVSNAKKFDTASKIKH